MALLQLDLLLSPTEAKEPASPGAPALLVTLCASTYNFSVNVIHNNVEINTRKIDIAQNLYMFLFFIFTLSNQTVTNGIT